MQLLEACDLDNEANDDEAKGRSSHLIVKQYLWRKVNEWEIAGPHASEDSGPALCGKDDAPRVQLLVHVSLSFSNMPHVPSAKWRLPVNRRKTRGRCSETEEGGVAEENMGDG